jgi:putative FmdB family regulatory protein
MPIYVHSCKKCGVMELFRSMKAKAPTKCPQCKRPGLERVYDCNFHRPFDMFQENENQGAGRWYPQMGKQYLDPHTKTKLNPASHKRSEYEAMEAFKRMGHEVQKY